MKLPNTGPTQKFLDILDIKDDLIIVKGPRFCMVLESTALNFDLLSEKEQDATIFAYANFVNSLSYPIQIVIKTRQINIDHYIGFLEQQEKLQQSEALRGQMEAYRKFIRQLVIENTILSKRFFVVIPYYQVTMSKPALPFMKKTGGDIYDSETLEKAKQIFAEREQELAWHLRRLGIELHRLNTQELIKLFFGIYNPQIDDTETLTSDVEGYLTPLVKPVTT
ncbi:hypothetical protein KJ596_01450 [Patescibacteria group bacterium]|nr:hypothetical protein [Patescibacteria group bacterium]MBU1868411.1 hypothetical protein [Patescibacteria group bacterium]